MKNSEVASLLEKYKDSDPPSIDDVLDALSLVKNLDDEPDLLDHLFIFCLDELHSKRIDFEQLTDDELYTIIQERSTALILERTCESLVKKGFIEQLVDSEGNFSYRILK